LIGVFVLCVSKKRTELEPIHLHGALTALRLGRYDEAKDKLTLALGPGGGVPAIGTIKGLMFGCLFVFCVRLRNYCVFVCVISAGRNNGSAGRTATARR
jgi:hypothetical protein